MSALGHALTSLGTVLTLIGVACAVAYLMVHGIGGDS